MLDEIEKIIRFAIKYGGGRFSNLNRKEFESAIKKHIIYKTCIIVYDSKKRILALTRWNIEKSGKVATILDLLIHPEHRNQGLIRKLLLKGHLTFPEVKYIVWERRSKYPNRDERIYEMDKLLRRKKQ